MLLREDCVSVTEVVLRTDRRVDLMGLCARGVVTIVEVKVSRADLLGDDKWTEYLDHCDRYYWAVPAGFNVSLLHRPAMLPGRTGVIVADRYDAAVVREAAMVPLAPGRRRVETLRFARRAARRLLGDLDQGAELAV